MSDTPATAEATTLQRHQWTHEGTKVRILRCDSENGISYGGFQWPESGRIEAPDWNTRPECGGGLHGWAWGFATGDGKEPNYSGTWRVFEADPADVIDLGGKVKARCGDVIFCGKFHEAWQLVLPGHVAFVVEASSGSASNSGDSGSASNSGDSGSASNSGYRGSASNSGDSGSASNSGDSGSASNSGDRGSATATGKKGIATSSGEWSTVEVGELGLAAVTADEFFWRVRTGAVCVQRTAEGQWLLTPESIGAADGDLVRIRHGKRIN